MSYDIPTLIEMIRVGKFRAEKMKTYYITVPVTGERTYELEAKDEESAKLRLIGMPYSERSCILYEEDVSDDESEDNWTIEESE